MVLRDVEGRSPSDASAALGLTPQQQREQLHQARGVVRARLERLFEGRQAAQ